MSVRARRLLALASVLAGLATAPSAGAVSLALLDDFETGTQGWTIGGAGPSSVDPQPLADGGPLGDGDGYLRLRSTGMGFPGSRLAVFNNAQWTGNYLEAGVAAIALEVRNFGATNLVLRWIVSDPFGGSNAPNSVITQGVALAAGADWTRVVFSLAPEDLVVRRGQAALALSNAAELRLFHSPTATFPPPLIAATLGIDNVRALAAFPEPGATTLVALGLLALGVARRARVTRTAPRGRCTPGAAASR